MSTESITVPCEILFEGNPADVDGSGRKIPAYMLITGISVLGVEIPIDQALFSAPRTKLELALEKILRDRAYVAREDDLEGRGL